MFKQLALKEATQKQAKIYADLYAKWGHSFKALHWSSPQNQEKRFEILAQIGDLDGCKILDLGCGFGDFYAYLKRTGVHCHYTGYDTMQEFINKAAREFGEASFAAKSIFENKASFDYILASGLFAFGNKTFFFETLERALKFAVRGLGFNLFKPQNDKRFFYMEKDEILFFLKGLDLGRVVIKDGYLNGDTTFFLYKKQGGAL